LKSQRSDWRRRWPLVLVNVAATIIGVLVFIMGFRICQAIYEPQLNGLESELKKTKAELASVRGELAHAKSELVTFQAILKQLIGGEGAVLREPLLPGRPSEED
jgi:hypothetical protein